MQPGMPMRPYPMGPMGSMKGKADCKKCLGTGMKFSKKKGKYKECKCIKKKK
jgi:hypothetical protein